MEEGKVQTRRAKGEGMLTQWLPTASATNEGTTQTTTGRETGHTEATGFSLTTTDQNNRTRSPQPDPATATEGRTHTPFTTAPGRPS